MYIKRKNLCSAAVVAASTATFGNVAQAQTDMEKFDIHGRYSLTLNDEGKSESRLELQSGDFSFAGEGTLSLSPLDEIRLPQVPVFAAVAWQQENLRLDAAYRHNDNMDRLRLGSQFHPNEAAECGLSLALGDSTVEMAGYIQGEVVEGAKIGFAANSDQEIRGRVLLTADDIQTAITAGYDGDDGLLGFSLDAGPIWISAEYRSNGNSSAQFVIGDIDENRTDKFTRFTHQGRSDLSEIPDILGAPERFSLGSNPEFLFGGRSELTFLSREPGSMAALVGWQERIGIRLDGALRLPDVAVFRDPYVSAGINVNSDLQEPSLRTRVGADIGRSSLSISGQVSEDGRVIAGILWSITF